MATMVMPNRDELLEELRVNAPGMILYQPSEQWFQFEHGGRTFWMPPHLPGTPEVEHPALRDKNSDPLMVVADGRLSVRDAYGYIRDARGKTTGRGLLVGMEAAATVLYACTEYGQRGVVWLRGDKSDGEKVKLAQKVYGRYMRTWAEQEVEGRAIFVRRWEAMPGNKGRTPPPPTAMQIRAQEYLDELRTGGRSGSTYICKHGCWEGDDFAKYQRHMWAQHGIRVQPERDETVENVGRGKTVTRDDVADLEREWTDEERAAAEAGNNARKQERPAGRGRTRG